MHGRAAWQSLFFEVGLVGSMEVAFKISDLQEEVNRIAGIHGESAAKDEQFDLEQESNIATIARELHEMMRAEFHEISHEEVSLIQWVRGRYLVRKMDLRDAK